MQLAMNALNGLKGVRIVVKGFDAANIVDGHREKAIAVLWGIVGRRA